MSKATKTQPAVQLEPRVNICEANAFNFLKELEARILAGYRVSLDDPFDLMFGLYSVTLVLPEA